ncbi:phospholipid carrier-dependent glycosyltransferase [Candidatus Pacearchaeota archaeon]|nr:MAG: phospholipid carrier-dependent glycosyltransferase [Candidatus Pacearchaeota archaeon]
MKKESKILIILFLMSFVIRFVFILSTPLKIWDETVYSNLGYDLSKDPFDYSVSKNGWSDFIPSSDKLYAWPRMGFRAPALPYAIALLYTFGIGNFSDIFISLIGAASVCLVYVLGKEMFGKEAAIYSALFFSLIPLHVLNSSKIMTEAPFTFFVILTFISFWKGYEKNDNKNKILFGFFLSLSLLSRYTALWIMPVFPLYFLIRDSSLKFLRDKYLWYSVAIFFITLSPWLLYGVFEYQNPIGPFIHGAKAASYWGGSQPPYFFLIYWVPMFSLTGLIFLTSLIYIPLKRLYKKEILLLIIWTILFIGIASLIPHKEGRFIIAAAPPISLISGYVTTQAGKYKKPIIALTIIASIVILSLNFYTTYKNSYTPTNICFLKGNEFLKNQEREIILTDESSIVYHYTKKITRFYPRPLNISSLKKIKDQNPGKKVLVFFTDFDMPLNRKENLEFKKSLDKNLLKIWGCGKPEERAAIYEL